MSDVSSSQLAAVTEPSHVSTCSFLLASVALLCLLWTLFPTAQGTLSIAVGDIRSSTINARVQASSSQPWFLDDDNSDTTLTQAPNIVGSISHQLPAAPALPTTPLCGPDSDAPVMVFMTGGLGNHLFLVALGIAASLARSGHTRGLVIGSVLPDSLRYEQTRTLPATLLAGLNVTPAWGEWLTTSARGKPLAMTTLNGPREWCQYSEQAVRSIADCGSAAVFFGYFQNVRYFLGAQREVRAQFATPAKDVAALRERFPDLLSPMAWAVHVRRGDFVEKQGFHNLVGLDYYAAAIDRVREVQAEMPTPENITEAGAPVFIFSDDLEWVRAQSLFSTLPDVTFVDEPDTVTAFQLLQLATRSGIVCGPSTFCWWAAFMRNLHAPRFAIFPERIMHDASFTAHFGLDDCGSGLLTTDTTILEGF